MQPHRILRRRPISLRAGLALLLVGALLGLGLGFGERVRAREAWLADCEAGGELRGECGQRRVFLALVDVVERDDKGVVVMKQARRLRLFGTPPDLRPGDTISVVARFDARGRLVVSELERHPWRPLKKGLGVLGVVLVLGLGVRGFGWERGGLVEHG